MADEYEPNGFLYGCTDSDAFAAVHDYFGDHLNAGPNELSEFMTPVQGMSASNSGNVCSSSYNDDDGSQTTFMADEYAALPCSSLSMMSIENATRNAINCGQMAVRVHVDNPVKVHSHPGAQQVGTTQARVKRHSPATAKRVNGAPARTAAEVRHLMTHVPDGVVGMLANGGGQNAAHFGRALQAYTDVTVGRVDVENAVHGPMLAKERKARCDAKKNDAHARMELMLLHCVRALHATEANCRCGATAAALASEASVVDGLRGCESVSSSGPEVSVYVDALKRVSDMCQTLLGSYNGSDH